MPDRILWDGVPLEELTHAQLVEIVRALVLEPAQPSRRSGAPRPPDNPGTYTGEVCIECGGVRMIRTGICSTCLDCGTSGGCG